MESKNYHELHSRLYDGMPRFFSSKNIVIMECRSVRHRSVANAELWSNTLALYSRYQHSFCLLHLSELDFWKIHVQENVRNAAISPSKFPDTPRSRPCWVFTTCRRARICDWSLEAIAISVKRIPPDTAIHEQMAT